MEKRNHSSKKRMINLRSVFSAKIFLRFIIISHISLITFGFNDNTKIFAQTESSIPLIWCTDLFHPPQDPDDHLDLITVFAFPEFDIRAVLLDQGGKQEKDPGQIVIKQMMEITGKKIPYAIGLADKLKSIDDTGEDQAPQYQGAVNLFLKTLEQSPDPVHVMVAGSLRDVVAAFNRNPELVKEKVAKFHINIGRAALAGGEWNVHLDAFAYRQLLESGLPVNWYPCLPLNSMKSSHWLLEHYGDVFETAPLEIQNLFIYAMSRVDTTEIDPLDAIKMNLRPWRRNIWEREKNMWCTASIIHASGRKIYRKGDDWMVLQGPPPSDATEVIPFTLVPARIQVDQKGFTKQLSYDSQNPNVDAIQSDDHKLYSEAMAGCLKYLFMNFPVNVEKKRKR